MRGRDIESIIQCAESACEKEDWQYAAKHFSEAIAELNKPKFLEDENVQRLLALWYYKLVASLNKLNPGNVENFAIRQNAFYAGTIHLKTLNPHTPDDLRLFAKLYLQHAMSAFHTTADPMPTQMYLRTANAFQYQLTELNDDDLFTRAEILFLMASSESTPKTAMEQFNQALAILEPLVSRAKEAYSASVARIYIAMAKRSNPVETIKYYLLALKAYENAARLRENRCQRIACHQALVKLYREKGYLKEALAHTHAAVSEMNDVLKSEPAILLDTYYKLASMHTGLAELYKQTSDENAMREQLFKAVILLKKIPIKKRHDELYRLLTYLYELIADITKELPQRVRWGQSALRHYLHILTKSENDYQRFLAFGKRFILWQVALNNTAVVLQTYKMLMPLTVNLKPFSARLNFILSLHEAVFNHVQTLPSLNELLLSLLNHPIFLNESAPKESIEACEKALKLLEKIAPPWRKDNYYLAVGMFFTIIGRHSQVLSLHDAARDVFARGLESFKLIKVMTKEQVDIIADTKSLLKLESDALEAKAEEKPEQQVQPEQQEQPVEPKPAPPVKRPLQADNPHVLMPAPKKEKVLIRLKLPATDTSQPQQQTQPLKP